VKISNVMPVASDEEAQTARMMAWWGKIPVFSVVQRVSTSRLWATQDDVSDGHLDRIEIALRGVSHASGDIGAIDVAEIGRRLVIVDGHHRATAALRLGWRHILASVRKPADQVSSDPKETTR
jgi:hypothetical protein